MDAVPTVLSKRRETLAIEACPLHISIWKRSRMLLKKLYFIVLFVFRLMSIKYTLTCVLHMWTCNTTWNINNEKMHIQLLKSIFWKNPLLSLIKRGRWSESFSYNSFKINNVNNKYYCIHFNDEKTILRFVFYYLT